MEKGTSAAGELRGKWCGWWDLPCEDLAQYERDSCKEDGLSCSPEECEFCLAGYAAIEAKADAAAEAEA